VVVYVAIPFDLAGSKAHRNQETYKRHNIQSETAMPNNQYIYLSDMDIDSLNCSIAACSSTFFFGTKKEVENAKKRVFVKTDEMLIKEAFKRRNLIYAK